MPNILHMNVAKSDECADVKRGNAYFGRLSGLLGLVGTSAALSAGSAYADQIDDLIGALRLSDMVQIMRDEGLGYADELAAEMFMDGTHSAWHAQVDAIYDADEMFDQVTQELREGLDGQGDLGPLIEFYRSDLGRDIVALELDARAAISDEDVEAAALDFFSKIDGSEDETYVAVQGYVQANDLIDQNVSGTLNSMYHFYSGLADGGAIAATENELLDQIWVQQDQILSETEEWLYAYLLMAFGPLNPDQIQSYTDLSLSPAGQRMNAALFAGFNLMYDEVSYALGRAAAGQMGLQEL